MYRSLEDAHTDNGRFPANVKSAQPCGCDEGAKYTCEGHTIAERILLNPDHTYFADAVADTPVAPNRCSTLPDNPVERKKYPIATGVLEYFPDAIAAVARVSYEGNEQHNPGQPLHWARGKSMDQGDTMIRHYLQRGSLDTDGQRHAAKMAWRALAILQLEIEAEGK